MSLNLVRQLATEACKLQQDPFSTTIVLAFTLQTKEVCTYMSPAEQTTANDAVHHTKTVSLLCLQSFILIYGLT